MAEKAIPTDTPEFGCFTDLSEQQAATAAPSIKGEEKADSKAASIATKE